MAGHNRWSKVKNFKGAIDSKRGKAFTKLVKEITVAARMGGASPETNPRLRAAIASAKEVSMPKENIDRAIQKGTGALEGASIDEATYEGYGPGGIAIIVETASDNKNRTVSELRNLFKMGGGHLGEAGSVAYLFTHQGHLAFDKAKHKEEIVMEVALESGAEDVSNHGDVIDVITSVSDVYKVKDGFDRVGMHPVTAGLSYAPKTTVAVDDRENAKRVLQLLHDLEEHDDVQHVHANFEIDDKLFSEITA